MSTKEVKTSKAVYALYKYNPDWTCVGKVGLAEFDGSTLARTGTLISDGLTGDTKVFAYKNPQGQDRIMVAQCVWNADYTAQPMKLTSYNENLEQVGNLKESNVSGVDQNRQKVTLKNAYSMAPIPGYNSNGGVWGRMLCLIDYDAGAVFGIPVTGDNAQLAGCHVYSSPKLEGRKSLGQDILTDGKDVYALFVDAADAYNGDYSGYVLTRLGDELAYQAEHYVPTKNPFTVSLYDTNLYITSVGGLQKKGSTNGEDSKIERIPKDFTAYTLEDSKNKVADGELVTVLKGGATPAEGDFRALAYTADGADAFIVTGRMDDDGNHFTAALYHTSMDVLEEVEDKKVTDRDVTTSRSVTFTSKFGTMWALMYSENRQALWMARGNDLAVYSYKADQFNELGVLDATTLAGGAVEFNVNGFALIGEGKNFKGAVLPAFASISKRALEERKKILENR